MDSRHRFGRRRFSRVYTVKPVGALLVLAGVTTSAGAQALLIFGDFYAEGAGSEAEVAVVLRIGLLAVAAWAAIRKRPWIVALAFLVHTVPAGLYMMLLPGLGGVAGLSTLLLPVGALLIYGHEPRASEPAR